MGKTDKKPGKSTEPQFLLKCNSCNLKRNNHKLEMFTKHLKW